MSRKLKEKFPAEPQELEMDNQHVDDTCNLSPEWLHVYYASLLPIDSFTVTPDGIPIFMDGNRILESRIRPVPLPKVGSDSDIDFEPVPYYKWKEVIERVAPVGVDEKSLKLMYSHDLIDSRHERETPVPREIIARDISLMMESVAVPNDPGYTAYTLRHVCEYLERVGLYSLGMNYGLYLLTHVSIFVEQAHLERIIQAYGLDEVIVRMFRRYHTAATTVVNVKVAYLRKPSSGPAYDNLEEWTKDSNNVYIGRAGIVFVPGSDGKKRRFPPQNSPFANPFKVDNSKPESRDEAISKYVTYIAGKLLEDPELNNTLLSYKGKRLGCWCHPEPCHGDVLAEYIENPRESAIGKEMGLH